MTITGYGTNHFVSFTAACRYYRDYDPALTLAELDRWVASKIVFGEICLGKPELKPGQRLVLLDSGRRYGIEE